MSEFPEPLGSRPGITQEFLRAGIIRPGEGLRPTGPAAAAVAAAGIAILALGVSSALSALVPPFEQALAELSHYGLPGGSALGSYGGQQLVMVLAWAASWAVLHARWKRRQVSLTATSIVLVVCLLTATLLLWPPFSRALIALASSRGRS